MSVLSNPLMDCDCSSACVAYKNGQFDVQTSINTIHSNCNSPEIVKDVGWRLGQDQYRVTHPCEKFLATPLRNHRARHKPFAIGGTPEPSLYL